MFKVITLQKRRPGMSRDEFKAYYEANHKRTGEAVLPGRATRYVRRYLKDPVAHPTDGNGGDEPEFDAIMEMWFEDEAAFRDAMDFLTDTPFGTYVVEDEEKLFDRSKLRLFIVEECESDLASLPRLDQAGIERALGIASPVSGESE